MLRNSYRKTVKKSNDVLEQIVQKSAGDPFIIQHLDTIKLLMQRKTDTQNRLIRLSRDQRRINVYEEVLSEIDSLKGQMRARVTLIACDSELAEGCPWVFEPWEDFILPKNIKFFVFRFKFAKGTRKMGQEVYD